MAEAPPQILQVLPATDWYARFQGACKNDDGTEEELTVN